MDKYHRYKKAPRGYSKPSWSLHMRSFWKVQFINPSEEGGQVVKLQIHSRVNDDAKVSKSPIWVNRKIAEYVPRKSGKNIRGEYIIPITIILITLSFPAIVE
jgi:hypothetical protein